MSLVATSLILVIGCSGGTQLASPLTPPGSDNAASLVSLRETPAAVTLAPGAQQQFSVVGSYSDGSSGSVSVTFSATGGTISSSGLYTAGSTAGTYRVIATQQGGSLADTSVVTIASQTLTSIAIVPSALQIYAGASEILTAFGTYSGGATGNANVTWSATGGAITSGGVYTAGSVTGSFSIIATQQGGSLADTIPVTIVPPGVTSPTGPGPNEPAGFTQVSANPFDALPPDNPAFDAYGYTKYYGTSNLSILSDGTAPASSPNFLRLLFPAGHGGGAAPNAFVAGHNFSAGGNKTRIYTRIRFRVSANWTDNGNTGTKFFFYDQTQGNNHYVNLTDGGTVNLAVNLQSTFGYSTPSGPNHPAAAISKGVWHDAEFLLIANTPGRYNGVARVWVDGARVINATDMGYFAAGQTPYWDLFWFNPTYGGGSNPVPANQNIDIDHWYTSVAP